MPTFEKAEAVCFAEKRETWRSDGRAKGWRRAMNRYVLPKIGAMPVDKVGSAAVYEVLRPIALAGKHSIVKVAGTAIAAVLAEARGGTRGALVFPGTRPGAMMGDVVMTQALRNAGVAASGHGFRSRIR